MCAPLLCGFYGKLVWLLGLKVCVTTAWSVMLTSGIVWLSDLQALFIKIQMNHHYTYMLKFTV